MIILAAMKLVKGGRQDSGVPVANIAYALSTLLFSNVSLIYVIRNPTYGSDSLNNPRSGHIIVRI